MEKSFENRPMSELVDMIKNDWRKFNEEGLIDEGTLIKTVMYCNEKLGIPVKDIKEVAINIENFEGELPLDFDKVYYMAALHCTNINIDNVRNAFDNNVDQDTIYKAHLDRESLGCVDNYKVTIERKGAPITYTSGGWTQLYLMGNSHKYCHTDCPNKRKPGKYEVEIVDGKLKTPFRTGIIYMIYIGLMQDDEGNILYPFHPLITPYYEWSMKEKIISDAIFNSDSPGLGELYKICQLERSKSWLDAFNFTIDDQSYGNYKKKQRERELGWYSKWFRYFQ